jgi:hypothetical protein
VATKVKRAKGEAPAVTQASLPPGLMRLRTVAALIDTPSETLRERAERGTWPRPTAIVDRDWYYPREWIEAWIKSGEWHADAVFRGRERA